MSASEFPILVSMLGLEADASPKAVRQGPHISVFPFHSNVVMEPVMCGGPVGECLHVEVAERLHLALGKAIKTVRSAEVAPPAEDVSASARCAVSWCQVTHETDDPPQPHRLEFAPFRTPTLNAETGAPQEIRVTLFQANGLTGPAGEPVVQISFPMVDGKIRMSEISSAEAGDLGELIDALVGRTWWNFTTTLLGAFWLSGGGV
ncbi:hypothetical protein [Streptosporangium sp. NPDC002524]|uniref:hypothetical protein n=1 Tax=Streptosporangium sp. NPDC002524 TaxID=3154537 RepID=UPI003318F4C7